MARMGVGVLPAPEVEVSAKATRRRFTAKEKIQLLDEVDACAKTGEIGALLRRKGVYSSSLHRWREARERGELEALTPKKRGPTTKVMSALERENQDLRRALPRASSKSKKKYPSYWGFSCPVRTT